MTPRVVSTIATAGATAVATLIVTGAAYVVHAFSSQLSHDGSVQSFLITFGRLSVSVLVVGAIACMLAAGVGLVRSGFPGRPTAGKRPSAAWVWVTTLFVVVAPAFILYMAGVIWLTNALYVGILALIVGLVAGVIFLIVIWPLARLTR